MDKLAQFVKKELSGKQLIVVSNREPYIHKKTGLSIKVEKPAGGLTSAMDDVLKATGGVWVAWGSGTGDTDVVDGHNRILVPPDDPSYILKRVWLSPLEADNYYHGYSNQVLWPLCHITLDRVYFRRKFWDYYLKVNRAFAEAVLEEAEADSAVWFHDYHLCLAPGFLREKKNDLTIAHFWHIPWPDWSVFRICPQSREILEGLLGSDLIGFQIPLFVRNFLDCARECLGAEIDRKRSTVLYRGRVTMLKAFPISIDFNKFVGMASLPHVSGAIREIRKRHSLPDLVGIGVDRLEYTKALIKRLQAIALFFDRYEKLRGRFTFFQIAVPTRLKEPYVSYRETVEKLIEDINKKFSRGSWKPIVYIDKKIEHRELVLYYRLADIAIISSIYDGMNLVAKEYAASQVDEKGVLILSELAGAADELRGAILVNPYDLDEFSATIKKALDLSTEEKRDCSWRLSGTRSGRTISINGYGIYSKTSSIWPEESKIWRSAYSIARMMSGNCSTTAGSSSSLITTAPWRRLPTLRNGLLYPMQHGNSFHGSPTVSRLRSFRAAMWKISSNWSRSRASSMPEIMAPRSVHAGRRC